MSLIVQYVNRGSSRKSIWVGGGAIWWPPTPALDLPLFSDKYVCGQYGTENVQMQFQQIPFAVNFNSSTPNLVFIYLYFKP